MLNDNKTINKPYTLRSNKGDVSDYVKQLEKNLLQLWNKHQYLNNEVDKLNNIITNGDINHSILDNLNSSTYSHLTATAKTDLTDGGFTVLHKHSWTDSFSVYVITGTSHTINTTYNQYVYSGTSAGTINLPSATGSGNRFTIKNSTTNTVTIDGYSSQTIDDETTQDLYQEDSVDLLDFISGKWAVV
jgi:hypothetical protein